MTTRQLRHAPGQVSAAGPAPRNKAPLVAAKIFEASIQLRRSASRTYAGISGLADSHSRIVLLVGDNQPLTLTELSAISALDAGQLSRGLTELERLEYLVRMRQGRRALLHLTDKGRLLYSKLRDAARQRNELLLEGLSEEERTTLLRQLDMIIDRASD